LLLQLHQNISQVQSSLQSRWQEYNELGERYKELQLRGVQLEQSQQQDVGAVKARLQQVQDSVRQSSSLRATPGDR
jgi:hypothetical protein